MPLFSETPDCQNCGACCSFHISVAVRRDDENLPFLIERDLVDAGDDANYRMKLNASRRCIALRGEVGKSVSCSIYENRPVTCRLYVAGAGQCEIARALTFSDQLIEENRRKEADV